MDIEIDISGYLNSTSFISMKSTVSKKAKKKIKTLTCTIKPSRSNPITNHKEVRLFKRIQNKFVPAFIYKELGTLS